MRRHVKAFTYEPKIPKVRSGKVTQTIRKGSKVAVGDIITFHGWEGRPYRSPWSWRLEVVVNEVIPFIVQDEGLMIEGVGMWAWDSPWVNQLAKLDGIVPPKGLELARLLFEDLRPTRVAGVMDGYEYQIIRWVSPEREAPQKILEHYFRN